MSVHVGQRACQEIIVWVEASWPGPEVRKWTGLSERTCREDDDALALLMGAGAALSLDVAHETARSKVMMIEKMIVVFFMFHSPLRCRLQGRLRLQV